MLRAGASDGQRRSGSGLLICLRPISCKVTPTLAEAVRARGTAPRSSLPRRSRSIVVANGDARYVWLCLVWARVRRPKSEIPSCSWEIATKIEPKIGGAHGSQIDSGWRHGRSRGASPMGFAADVRRELGLSATGDVCRLALRQLVAAIDPDEAEIGSIFRCVRSIVRSANGKYEDRLTEDEFTRFIDGLSASQAKRVLKRASDYGSVARRLRDDGGQAPAPRIWVLPSNTSKRKARYKFSQQCGLAGAYGTVFKGTAVRSGARVAIKRMAKQRLLEQKALEAAQEEIRLMQSMRPHPNVVAFHDVFEDEEYLYLAMERLNGGELFSRIDQELLEDSGAKSIASQIFAGLAHLHSQGIAHCDLKPENMVFAGVEKRYISNRGCTSAGAGIGQSAETKKGDSPPRSHSLADFFHKFGESALEQWEAAKVDAASARRANTLKIIDFGVSKHMGSFSERLQGARGTTHYMAPEVLDGEFSIHCDCWSAGVILFMMLYGYCPFDYDAAREKDTVLVSKIRQGFSPVLRTGRGPWFNSEIPVSKEARALIAGLLERNPVRRTTASEALLSPWFRQVGGAIGKTQREMVISNLTQVHTMTRFRKMVLKMAATKDLGTLDSMFRFIEGAFSREEAKRARPDAGEPRASADTNATDSDIRLTLSQLSKHMRELSEDKVQVEIDGGQDHTRTSLLESKTPEKPVRRRDVERELRKELEQRFSPSSPRYRKGVNGKRHSLSPEPAFSLKDLRAAALNAACVAKEERLLSIFKSIDRDGDGVVDAEELVRALEGEHVPAAHDDIAAALAEVDVNGDQKVDYEEFRAAFGVMSFQDYSMGAMGSAFSTRTQFRVRSGSSVANLSKDELPFVIRREEDTQGSSTPSPPRKAPTDSTTCQTCKVPCVIS